MSYVSFGDEVGLGYTRSQIVERVARGERCEGSAPAGRAGGEGMGCGGGAPGWGGAAARRAGSPGGSRVRVGRPGARFGSLRPPASARAGLGFAPRYALRLVSSPIASTPKCTPTAVVGRPIRPCQSSARCYCDVSVTTRPCPARVACCSSCLDYGCATPLRGAWSAASAAPARPRPRGPDADPATSAMRPRAGGWAGAPAVAAVAAPWMVAVVALVVILCAGGELTLLPPRGRQQGAVCAMSPSDTDTGSGCAQVGGWRHAGTAIGPDRRRTRR